MGGDGRWDQSLEVKVKRSKPLEGVLLFVFGGRSRMQVFGWGRSLRECGRGCRAGGNRAIPRRDRPARESRHVRT